jgi:hypothetical protein
VMSDFLGIEKEGCSEVYCAFGTSVVDWSRVIGPVR